MIVTTSISLTDYNSILLKTIIKYFVAHVNHEKHSGAENLGIGLDVKVYEIPVPVQYWYLTYTLYTEQVFRRLEA